MRLLAAFLSSPTVDIFSLFGFCLSDGYEMVSYCGLNLIGVDYFIYLLAIYFFLLLELPAHDFLSIFD